MAPLRREWAAAKQGIEALHVQWQPLAGNARRRLQSVAEAMVRDFVERLAGVRILDPACGSGNFLYVALNQLLDLEKEAWQFAGGLGLEQPELAVSPAQLFGIEKNPFAAELAQVVVWIGYLQWMKLNGFLEGKPAEPILQALHNIQCRDAILALDADNQPIEPDWPEADVIIGNPPFLGSKKLRGELGADYFEDLRTLYDERVSGGMDLVMYWFERARTKVEVNKELRVGLLATNSIRQQRNRDVLQQIKHTGDIFMAWSDRAWVLDGAAVRVSMVGFDGGSEAEKMLDGIAVATINADLTASLDTANMRRLPENASIAFMGNIKVGPFDLAAARATEMLAHPNQSGRLNGDVVRPLANGEDITGIPRDEWIIDFGPTRTESEAALYELPYQHVKQYVKPERETNNRASYRRLWWIHGEPRPAMWNALKGRQRYIVTVLVAKHRLFAWLPIRVSPAARLIVFAREDDYFFGVLHSKAHELWSLRMGARHGDGDDGGRPTYNISTCFETFPFPYAPGAENQADPLVQTIADATRRLVALRDGWLAGGEPTSDGHLTPDNGQLTTDKTRTLTNLYNKRPDWLDIAHRQLDAAVFAAYGWPHDLSDDAILERLLRLNGARAGGGERAGAGQ